MDQSLKFEGGFRSNQTESSVIAHRTQFRVRENVLFFNLELQAVPICFVTPRSRINLKGVLDLVGQSNSTGTWVSHLYNIMYNLTV